MKNSQGVNNNDNNRDEIGYMCEEGGRGFASIEDCVDTSI